MKKIYVIAGEPSGDFLGVGVIRELLKGSSVEIFGVGGNLMASAGLRSLFDIQEISIGGVFEIVPSLLRVKKLIDNTVSDILTKDPDILLTIDSPGFCFRVAKLVRRKNPKIKLVHLVAPSVWAWRPKRAEKLAKLYDHLLTLFDFEPQYFAPYGLPTTFVGHPAIEHFSQSSEKEDVLLILPGSRRQEIKTLLPIFLEASRGLKFGRIVIPTLPHLECMVKEVVGDWPITIVTDESEKRKLYMSAKCAIVASGTATLQLALSGCPMVVCYKLSNLSYLIIKRFVKVQYISLVNLILGKSVVPELIQSDCTPESIVRSVSALDLESQQSDFNDIRQRLINGDMLPSARIARKIMDLFL